MHQEFRHLRHAQAQRQRHRDDQQRAAVEVDAGQDVDPGRRHRAEHHHRGAAQHRLRHRLDHAGHRRKQAQDHQEQRDPHADVAAGDAGQLDHAVVLGEDRAGEGIEDPGQQRVGAVHQHAALDARHPQWPFDRLARDLAGGGDVADRFQRRHQIDHQHRHEQRPRETEPEVQRRRHLEPRRLVHACEVEPSEPGRQRIADGERDDDGGTPHPHHRHPVDGDDDAQHHARQQQVLAVGEAAVGHRRVAAAHADQADLDQGEADHQHHDAGHQGRDQALDERQDARHAHLDEGAGHHHAEDRGHHRFHRRAFFDHQRAARDQRADEIEAGALHDQEARAERPETAALDEGGDAGNDQRHRDDQVGVARRHAQRLADQQARRHDRDDDRQQVLQGREHAEQRGRAVVQAEDQFRAGCIRGGRRVVWAH